MKRSYYWENRYLEGLWHKQEELQGFPLAFLEQIMKSDGRSSIEKGNPSAAAAFNSMASGLFYLIYNLSISYQEIIANCTYHLLLYFPSIVKTRLLFFLSVQFTIIS